MPYRIQEGDLVGTALRIMSEQNDNFITTSELINKLEETFQPEGHDAETLEGRADTYFSQKVRNLISHRDSPNNFIYNGYAEYLPNYNGLKLTPKGLDLLREIEG